MEAPRSEPAALRGRTMQDQPWLFRDREDAGYRLAARLERYRDQQPVVLALPRGGVPVAFQIARALQAPLDVLPVRKLGAPGQPELAIGAIAIGGVGVLNEETIRRLGITQGQIDRLLKKAADELNALHDRFPPERPFSDWECCTAILVDDGLATGASALAAIRAVRTLHPRQIVLAVPVCAPETAAQLRPEVDDLVCLACPENFFAVGLWYRDFRQISDEAVLDLLRRSRGERAQPATP